MTTMTIYQFLFLLQHILTDPVVCTTLDGLLQFDALVLLNFYIKEKKKTHYIQHCKLKLFN